MLRKAPRFIAIAVPLLMVGGVVGTAEAASAPAPPPRPPAANAYVSTHGVDAGTCPKTAPCATVNYAISVAPSGGTVLVEQGRYNQTVDITKPVTLLGIDPHNTIIDGSGIDPGGSDYGVVYVGAAGGAVTVSNLTITDPYPYSYTGGEPEAVALADPNPADSVTISNDIITEGTADAGAASDFPIGIDTFKNSATTTITGNTISGFFQGALLEDNGPATVSGNTFQNLIANTYAETSYPAEGVFFLSDLAQAITGQNAVNNSFSDYAGYGLAAAAGYSGGYCAEGCNGSLSGTFSGNSFDLTGASGAAAISLDALYPENTLTLTLSGNKGNTTSPSDSIDINATGGGALSVSEQNNNIGVRPAPPGPPPGPASARVRPGARHLAGTVSRHVRIFGKG